MALKVGELYTTIGADNKPFKRVMNDSEKAFKRLAKVAISYVAYRGLKMLASSMIGAVKVTTEYSSALTGLQRIIEAQGKSFDTAKTFIDSSRNTGNTNAIAQQIVIVEKQIAQKEKDMEYYLKKDWPKNYSATRLEKEKLVNKLIGLKEQQAKGANTEVSELVRYKAYGKAAFRVLLLFISVLITRRIFHF